MSNLARRRVGQYIVEGSLSHNTLVDPGLVNNAFDGYLVPTTSGGSVTYDVVSGVKYKTHVFDSSSTLTVSGSPRAWAYTSVRGGGGGGSYRFNYGEYGGGGGAGGLGSSWRPMAPGSNTITIGGGGSVSNGGTGGTGGSSVGLGITSTGGTGGTWSGTSGCCAGSAGSTSSTLAPFPTNTWGINNDKAGGGSGGAGGRWREWIPDTDATAGSSGRVVVRFRWTK